MACLSENIERLLKKYFHPIRIYLKLIIYINFVFVQSGTPNFPLKFYKATLWPILIRLEKNKSDMRSYTASVYK